ncbi:signal peptidase [Salana multivorans]|uniref:Signal peptidase I n=1 Tax=Salana multivorans TaxID=120377 RepID=A0A3N2DCN3_9MICO|nr:signal peptidase I [Salana multivorans]ROR97555.1 signal peptidase [Salana multivorans]
MSTSTPARRIAATAASWVVNVIAVAGVAATVVALVALLTGVRPVVFISGSMSPTIQTGALALTAPVAADGIEEGDVISVTRADGVRVTHRAVELVAQDGRVLLVMKGDANTDVDAERYDVTDGADRVIWHVEGAGSVVGSLSTPWIVVGAVALVLIALIPGKRARPTADDADAAGAGAADDDAAGAGADDADAAGAASDAPTLVGAG